jgi:ATP-dependent Lon protease
VEQEVQGQEGPQASPQDVLDDDHYGLEKVKDRIVEYLAVQQRANKLKAPILCLVGPPGVGKTSLGKSIAKATGRKFVRMSLGGVRDEAEIRGHRRTYIGSMPGKIIQSMRKAEDVEPAVPARRDRQDGHGLPRRSVVGAARGARPRAEPHLQRPLPRGRLRPVERDVHHDGEHAEHPGPLLDRMEIIRIAGYTEDEKVEIARKHLIPNAIAKHGLIPRMVDRRRCALRDHDPLHARSGRAQPRARALQHLPQGGEGAMMISRRSR